VGALTATAETGLIGVHAADLPGQRTSYFAKRTSKCRNTQKKKKKIYFAKHIRNIVYVTIATDYGRLPEKTSS